MGDSGPVPITEGLNCLPVLDQAVRRITNVTAVRSARDVVRLHDGLCTYLHTAARYFDDGTSSGLHDFGTTGTLLDRVTVRCIDYASTVPRQRHVYSCLLVLTTTRLSPRSAPTVHQTVADHHRTGDITMIRQWLVMVGPSTRRRVLTTILAWTVTT